MTQLNNEAPRESASAAAAKPLATTPLKVALVEDQPEARQSWSKLINDFPDFVCICACATAEEALRTIPQARPDIILVDIFLPRISGIECTARLKEALPDTQIVILTAMDDKELVFMALEAGADGYLLKRTKPSELRSALLSVAGGGVPLSSQIARRLIGSFRRKSQNQNPSARLTVREEQILLQLSQGYSNKQIADQLGVSIDTVCSHLKNVFRKLHVSSRTAAVMRYMESKSALRDHEI